MPINRGRVVSALIVKLQSLYEFTVFELSDEEVSLVDNILSLIEDYDNCIDTMEYQHAD